MNKNAQNIFSEKIYQKKYFGQNMRSVIKRMVAYTSMPTILNEYQTITLLHPFHSDRT